jgi:hypothetical protein
VIISVVVSGTLCLLSGMMANHESLVPLVPYWCVLV